MATSGCCLRSRMDIHHANRTEATEVGRIHFLKKQQPLHPQLFLECLDTLDQATELLKPHALAPVFF